MSDSKTHVDYEAEGFLAIYEPKANRIVSLRSTSLESVEINFEDDGTDQPALPASATVKLTSGASYKFAFQSFKEASDFSSSLIDACKEPQP